MNYKLISILYLFSFLRVILLDRTHHLRRQRKITNCGPLRSLTSRTCQIAIRAVYLIHKWLQITCRMSRQRARRGASTTHRHLYGLAAAPSMSPPRHQQATTQKGCHFLTPDQKPSYHSSANSVLHCPRLTAYQQTNAYR